MDRPPPHPRPRQDSKPALHRAPRAARSARRLRRPHHQEATRASYRGEHMSAPGRAAPTPRRRARSARPRPGCRRRPGAQRAHAIGAERVARGGDGSQRLCPARRKARSALAPSVERGARDGDQARCTRPGAQRPRHRSRARSARRGAGRAGGAPVCALSIVTTGRLLPASATLRS